MRKMSVIMVLLILVFSYIPNNELNNNSNFTEENIQLFSQNQGINEYNPILATGSGIEIDVNFTATQSQVWFKVYSLGPDTWINYSIESASEEMILQYRAHTSLNQCDSDSIYIYPWYSNSNSGTCNNPTDDPTIC